MSAVARKEPVTMTRERRALAVAMAANFTMREIADWLDCSIQTVMLCLRSFDACPFGYAAYFRRERDFMMRAWGMSKKEAEVAVAPRTAAMARRGD